MVRGVFLSLLVHAAVFAMIAIGWPQPRNDCERLVDRLRGENPAITDIDILMQAPQCAAQLDLAVEFTDVGLVADMAAIPDAKVTEEAPVPDAPADETTPEIDNPDELTPEDNLDVNRVRADEEPDAAAVDERAAPKTAQDKKADKKPEDEPLVQKTKPKPKDDFEGLLSDAESALRNKSQTKRAQTANDEPPPIQKPVLDKAQAPRAGAGDRKGNTASLAASLNRQISVCWQGVDDLPKEDQIVVTLNVSLARDGSVIGDPELISPTSRPMGRAGLPVDHALRAVRKCAPYKLPAQDYDYWKDIQVPIGPKDKMSFN
jgi:hypothetical protein